MQRASAILQLTIKGRPVNSRLGCFQHTGSLVWLSIRAKSISAVAPEGVECYRVAPHMPDFVVSELEWFWESLLGVTCCKSLIVVYDEECILQIGVEAASCEDGEAVEVDFCQKTQGYVVKAHGFVVQKSQLSLK